MTKSFWLKRSIRKSDLFLAFYGPFQRFLYVTPEKWKQLCYRRLMALPSAVFTTLVSTSLFKPLNPKCRNLKKMWKSESTKALTFLLLLSSALSWTKKLFPSYEETSSLLVPDYHYLFAKFIGSVGDEDFLANLQLPASLSYRVL